MLDRVHNPDVIEKFRVPPSRVDNLYEKGFSKAEIHALVAPRRTLDRRFKNDELLTISESDRVERLERIMEHAYRVFGDKAKAERWLRKPNRAMNKAVPVELLGSETGAAEVDRLLYGIEYGMFS